MACLAREGRGAAEVLSTRRPYLPRRASCVFPRGREHRPRASTYSRRWGTSSLSLALEHILHVRHCRPIMVSMMGGRLRGGAARVSPIMGDAVAPTGGRYAAPGRVLPSQVEPVPPRKAAFGPAAERSTSGWCPPRGTTRRRQEGVPWGRQQHQCVVNVGTEPK